MLLPLTNCTAPGTALLGPAFTGATTKSAVRTSLSLTSNHIVKNLNESTIIGKDKIIKIVKKLDTHPKLLDQLNLHN